MRWNLLIFMNLWVASIAWGRPCDLALQDGNVLWEGVRHDSFSQDYRRPFGAVTDRQDIIQLVLETCRNDVTSVQLRVWNDVSDTEAWLQPTRKQDSYDATRGPITRHVFDLAVPQYPTLLYYLFALRDGDDEDFYGDDDPRFQGGGLGKMTDLRDDFLSYQITVYSHTFRVPQWLQGAVVYQVFPDRFANGDLSNDPIQGQDWIYGRTVRKLEWDQPLCDPRTAACFDEHSNQFYGGDLAGIIAKLPYLRRLGVSVLYMNPIMQAPSNHHYDVQNFFAVDPYLGSLKDFQQLTAAARLQGIRVLVDGSFNHTSSDHPFFDYYSRWDRDGVLIHPEGSGFDDGSGACESPLSPYRTWYFLPDKGSPALGDDRRSLYRCPRGAVNEAAEQRLTYESWFGFHTLPKLRTSSTDVQQYFSGNSTEGVGPFWLKHGASGWRLDVAEDVDAGPAREPGNSFWENFRDALRRVTPDAVMVGEEWGDGSHLLLGHELDTVLNYRFRTAVLGWLADTCKGRGCKDGQIFIDNDSNDNSVLGPIRPLSESAMLHQLQSIQEDYPPASWAAAFNLLGSHDTNRLGFLLEKISGGNAELRQRKQELVAIFQYAFPGSPATYYGDEIGIDCPGRYHNGTWQDDPYNRCTFPWDQVGSPRQPPLLALYQDLGTLRRTWSALRHGTFQVLHVNDVQRTMAFARVLGDQTIVAIFNRSDQLQDVNVDISALPGVFQSGMDLLAPGRKYVVDRSRLSISEMPATSGLLLHLNGQ